MALACAARGVRRAALRADARASLQVIDIPDAVNTLLDYSIAVIRAGTNSRGGHAFMTYALSARAQAIFIKWGFTRAAGP